MVNLKKTILAPLACMALYAAPASADCQLVVEYADETPAKEFEITVDSKLTFTADDLALLVNTTDESQGIPLRDIKALKFKGSFIGIDLVQKDPSLVLAQNPVGDILRVVGASDQPQCLSVTSLAGAVALTLESWRGEDVNVASLPQGIYVHSIDEKSIKFIKK